VSVSVPAEHQELLAASNAVPVFHPGLVVVPAIRLWQVEQMDHWTQVVPVSEPVEKTDRWV